MNEVSAVNEVSAAKPETLDQFISDLGSTTKHFDWFLTPGRGSIRGKLRNPAMQCEHLMFCPIEAVTTLTECPRIEASMDEVLLLHAAGWSFTKTNLHEKQRLQVVMAADSNPFADSGLRQQLLKTLGLTEKETQHELV